MNKEKIKTKKKRPGIKRRATKKDRQIKWTEAAQIFAVEKYLEGWVFEKISRGVGAILHKDVKEYGFIDAQAVKIKAEKLLTFYRFESPAFSKIKDRTNELFTKREDNYLLKAIDSSYIKEEYKNPYDYIKRVFGRTEDQLKQRVSQLLKKNKPVLCKGEVQ